MFHSTQHLPQRLSREHYTSPEILQREIERMFLPGWQMIGTLADAPNSGDYFTREILGTPVICWHTEHGFRAYLNVCTHRFCTLTDKVKGHFADRMKCQYHGWEYDESGNTCKIPDAQNFRPLTKGELGLREFRTESIGQVVFVNFSDSPVSAREYMGPRLTAWLEKYFSPQHRLTLFRDMTIKANWKIVTENVLESYHLTCVHPKSFMDYPEAERMTHEFHPTYDYYRHDSSNVVSGSGWEKFFARIAGREPELYWEHILRYPNIVLGGTGPWHYIQCTYPVDANTCRGLWYTFHNAGPRGRLDTFLLHRYLYRIGAFMSRRVQNEDGAIYPSVHRGISSKLQPHGAGLISAREERIFTFQDYVLKTLTTDKPESVLPMPPPAQGIEAPELRHLKPVLVEQ